MIDMVARKRVKYPHGPTGKEYTAGQGFVALSERDAKALFIAGKAAYAVSAKPNVVDLPSKAATPEVVEEPAPLPEAPTYWRRDMTAFGQTGEEASPPSSRRGRPRKQQTSDFSEDDAE